MRSKLPDKFEVFKSLQVDPVLRDLEERLRAEYLLFHEEVQRLMKTAAFGSADSRFWAIRQLEMIIEAELTERMRTGNVWGPLAPPQLISTGNLHLCDQLDGVPWKIQLNALTRGLLLTGPQGGGKSRLLIWLCRQFSTMYPDIPFFILDPKRGLKEWSSFLNAAYIDIEDISIDLSPPAGLTYEKFLPELIPQAGDILGLIFSVELMQEAVHVCIDLRNQSLQNGKVTEICLFDILQALSSAKDTSKGRRMGYKEAATTSLGRVILGSGNIFKCRKGIDLKTLFNRNVILGTRSITDDYAARFLLLFLLFWLHESERYAPPSDTLKRVLVIDDATRYLSVHGGYDAAKTTSPITNIFAQLRSSGNGVISTTQIPHLADPGILALSHTIINVGGLHYGKDRKLLGEMMGLNSEQIEAIGRLENRQAIGFCAGSDFPRVVFGRTPDVPDSWKGGFNG